MTEREQRLACLYFGREMKLGQSVTIAEFAKGAGVGIESVIESVKWIKPYTVQESFELEFSSDFKSILKKKSFDELMLDCYNDYLNNKQEFVNQHIWNKQS